MDGICKLCQRTGRIRKSHIIPEFLYESIYDEKHRGIYLATEPNRILKYEQKGIRELLLCSDCEIYLSQYEGYGKKILSDIQEENSSSKANFYLLSNIEYSKFKLFLISVLWRAGISSIDFFSKIILSKNHEIRMREMLLNRDPGEPYEYGCAITENKLAIINEGIIMRPKQLKIMGHRFYYFIFPGILWYFIVSHHSKQFPLKDRFLSKNGELTISRIPTEFENILVPHLGYIVRLNSPNVSKKPDNSSTL
jgi:hypothetical protein